MQNISMKALIFFSIVILVALGVFFINGSDNANTVYDDYQIIELSEAPEEINTKYQNTKTQTGFFAHIEDDITYVLINRGQVNTSGHKIEVKKIVKSKDKFTIKAKFIEPGPDDIVAMVISYPAIVVKIPEKVDNLEVIVDDDTLSQLK